MKIRSRAERAHLLIPARGSDRKRYLVAPRPDEERPAYYWRMETPKWLRAKYPKLPRALNRSTHTSDLKTARLRARDEIEMLMLEGHQEHAKFIEKLCGGAAPAPARFATLKEVTAAYAPDPDEVSATTARDNRAALRLIVREALGVDNVDALLRLTADRWATGETFDKWIALRKRRIVATSDHLARQSMRTTINSTLTQARSVFAVHVMKLYDELRLPDLTPVRAVQTLPKGQKSSSRFEPLPPTCLVAMDADALLLKRGASTIAAAAGLDERKQREVYKVYLLMRSAGLRNIEVEKARWEWLEERWNGTTVLSIRLRPYFKSKNGKYGDIELPPAVLAGLLESRGEPDEPIIRADHETERTDICHDDINAWVRRFIPPRQKGAYNLRKQAGSEIVTRAESEGGGIASAAAFLRDSIATTEKHYGTYLRQVRGVDVGTAETSPDAQTMAA